VPPELSVKSISQFIVHVFDLVEAEGRCLRETIRGEAHRAQAAAAGLAMGAVFLVVSIPLLVAGIGLLAAGLMWWLETQVTRPLAACLTGLVILLVAGACLLCFKRLTGRARP